MERTLTAEAAHKIGQEISLMGWVHTKRDHGKITFVDIRDRSGVLQTVGGAELKALNTEDVVIVTGLLKERPEHLRNPKIATGDVELEVKQIEVLNQANTLPFPIDTKGYEIDEELRLKYRYLDLRRSRLATNIRQRSLFVQAAREYLFKQGFAEIETPLLTKSTKEGSRDFVVPSRLQPGKFFALPQSPQQYKQLLMVAGFERYFQLARCVRDEDLRADRGFEHTQIDMEMSFVNREEVMRLTEGMIVQAIEAAGGKIAHKPFPVISYQEAMAKYGADKFDPRTEEEKQQGLLSFVWVVDFPFFKKVDVDDSAEVADGKSGWTFTHNPFSQPKEEHLEWHLNGTHIEQILTTQYDLVCNGYEVGGGSIRAHRPEVLKATYKIMGYSEQEIEEQVGHMLEAFSFGAPPHGGIAPGVERLIMILQHEEYLREVQAFPQTGKGNTSVMTAPAEISQEQLDQLGLALNIPKGNVFERLTETLKRSGYNFRLIEHAPVKTSQEAAAARGTSIHQGAKALVLDTDAGRMLFVLPADLKAELKTLKQQLGLKKVELVAFADIERVTTVTPGAVPPFGSLMGLKTVVDARLANNEQIAFNAGRQDRSIQMRYADFLKLEQPKVIDLT